MAKLSAGQVLSQDEVADMLAFDELGVARPEQYDNVVFDATNITGAVYRVRTADEQKEADAVHAANLAAGKAAEERTAKARKTAGEAAVAAAAAASAAPPVSNVSSVDRAAARP